MFRPLRTLISLTVLAGIVWFSFAIELGDKTLAEHVDTISATPEAKQLLDGTRETVNPAIQDVRDRMLGEYVEAPTWIGPQDETVPASTLPPSSRERASRVIDAPEPTLPGRRRVRAEPIEIEDEEEAPPPEPARPGWRLRPNVLVQADVEPAPEPEPEPEPTPEPAIAKPIDLADVPLPRAPAADRSFLAPWLELAHSVPPAPEPTSIPILDPVIEPSLPELPGSR